MKRKQTVIILLFFLSFQILSIGTVVAGATGNLLNNPGFENGNTSGWTNWGCGLRIAWDQVHSGNCSVLAYNRTQTWQGPVQSILGALEEGKTYTISGWVRLQNASEDRIGITVNQVDSDGTHYHGVSWSTGYSDRWILLSGEFSLNVIGSLSALNLYFEGPAPGVNFYLDDAEVLLIAPPQPGAVGSVDIDTIYQELEGFGASGAWYENWLIAHPKRNEIYNILFGQLGLDIYRIRNTYGISESNIRDSATIIRAAEDSLAHPIKVMISSWSAPPYLKSNANTVGGTLKKDVGGNYMYDEFAQWWADSLVEYSSRGIIADYINIQNEPDYLGAHDTCKFTPVETTQWAGYNLAFETVYQELSSQMAEAPKLLAAEACGCGASHAYIDALIVPIHAYGYAHHLYADGDYDNPDSFVPAMENFGTRYGGKPLFQTEYSGGSDIEQLSVALNLARHIHNSLVHEGTCSFFYWNLFWGDEGGLVTLDNPWQSNPGYTINPVYYAFKHYSAFTDPGWYRVEASTDSPGLRISAFISPDSIELSVIVINVSDIDIDLSLSLEGFSLGSSRNSRIYRTSRTENTAYIGKFDYTQPLTFPAQSITTINLTGTVEQ